MSLTYFLYYLQINIANSIQFSIAADRFRTDPNADQSVYSRTEISRSTTIDSRILRFRLVDIRNRPLDLYATVTVGKAAAIRMAFWVPFWIVNKSGIPLIIRQDTGSAAADDAAGQFDEHERAKDKNALMFSFTDESSSQQ